MFFLPVAHCQNSLRLTTKIRQQAHEGRINDTTVLLEGSRNTSGGQRVEVDLSVMKQDPKSDFSLFPGQIVAVEGLNCSGRKLVAHRICEGAAMAPMESTVGELIKYHHNDSFQDGSPLQIVTASGPFTCSDNLDYEPFNDFMKKVRALRIRCCASVTSLVNILGHMVRIMARIKKVNSAVTNKKKGIVTDMGIGPNEMGSPQHLVSSSSCVNEMIVDPKSKASSALMRTQINTNDLGGFSSIGGILRVRFGKYPLNMVGIVPGGALAICLACSRVTGTRTTKFSP